MSLSAHVSPTSIVRYRTLFNSVRSGDEPTVRTLLAEGMDVNLRGPRGATPLHIAARFGQLAMVDLLLAHGANSDARDDRGATPFDKARSSGVSSLATKLSQSLPTNPPQTAMSALGAGTSMPVNTPSHTPAIATPGARVGSSHSTEDAMRCRRLLEAAYRGDTASLEEMLSAEPQLVRMPGPRGATALHVAARYGHPQAVALLLRKGGNPLSEDDKGGCRTT